MDRLWITRRLEKNLFSLSYAFFWVIPRRLNFICRRFGTLSLFHFHRQVGMKYLIPTQKKSIQHSEHGESLKSRIIQSAFLQMGYHSVQWSFVFISIQFVGKYMRHPNVTLHTPGCKESNSLSKTYHHTLREGRPSVIRVVTPYVGTTSVHLSVP